MKKKEKNLSLLASAHVFILPYLDKSSMLSTVFQFSLVMMLAFASP